MIDSQLADYCAIVKKVNDFFAEQLRGCREEFFRIQEDPLDEGWLYNEEEGGWCFIDEYREEIEDAREERDSSPVPPAVPFGITFDVSDLNSDLEDFLSEVDEFRKTQSAEAFAELERRLDFRLDFPAMYGPAFAPRILPNGAVLICHGRRAVALSDDFAKLRIPAARVRAQLAALAAFAREHFPGDTGVFSVLTQGEAGFTWSPEVPGVFPARGHTLVFLDRRLVDAAAASPGALPPHHLVRSEAVHAAAAAAYSDHCTLQVFATTVRVFSDRQLRDKYINLLENFAHRLDEEPDGRPRRLLVDAAPTLVDLQLTKFMETLVDDVVCVRSREMKALVSSKLLERHKANLTAQITNFPPIFGP